MLTLTAYVTPSLARTASGCSQPRAGFATNELSAISPNTVAKTHRSPPDDILHTSLALSYFKCAFIVIQIINSRTLFDSGHSQWITYAYVTRSTKLLRSRMALTTHYRAFSKIVGKKANKNTLN